MHGPSLEFGRSVAFEYIKLRFRDQHGISISGFDRDFTAAGGATEWYKDADLDI